MQEQTKTRAALTAAIQKMFEAQRDLCGAFPKRPFTPDGRMIGDIGEAIAEIDYQVTVDPKSRKDWDGKREGVCEGCREVQIKATQKDSVDLKEPPDSGCLLVFKILRDGSWECCYNGDIGRVWKSLGENKASKSGEKSINVDALKKLNQAVEGCDRIALRQDVTGETSSLTSGGDGASSVLEAGRQTAALQDLIGAQKELESCA